MGLLLCFINIQFLIWATPRCIYYLIKIFSKLGQVAFNGTIYPPLNQSNDYWQIPNMSPNLLYSFVALVKTQYQAHKINFDFSRNSYASISIYGSNMIADYVINNETCKNKKHLYVVGKYALIPEEWIQNNELVYQTDIITPCIIQRVIKPANNAPDVVSKAKKSFSVEPIKIQQKQDPFLFEIYFDEILLVLYPLFFCIIFFILPFWIVMGSAISSCLYFIYEVKSFGKKIINVVDKLWVCRDNSKTIIKNNDLRDQCMLAIYGPLALPRSEVYYCACPYARYFHSDICYKLVFPEDRKEVSFNWRSVTLIDKSLHPIKNKWNKYSSQKNKIIIGKKSPNKLNLKNDEEFDWIPIPQNINVEIKFILRFYRPRFKTVTNEMLPVITEINESGEIICS